MSATEAVSLVRRYSRLLIDLHSLIQAGKGDDDAADAVRDAMDGPWQGLTRQERQRVEGLSEDLYAMAEKRPQDRAMSPREKAEWQQRAQAAFAEAGQGNVDGMLSFLRQPAPADLPRYVIPFLQARCWEQLGNLETALVFMQEAERYDPRQAVMVMDILRRLGRMADALEHARYILQDADADPGDIYQAAAWSAIQAMGGAAIAQEAR